MSNSTELRLSFSRKFSFRAFMYRSFHAPISFAICFRCSDSSSAKRFYNM